MTIALNPTVPAAPAGSSIHPLIPNVCAFHDGTVMTFDPRVKQPVWRVCQGILNTHGRRQTQIAKKMRMHYHIVYECITKTTPKYHTNSGNGMTIDHIDGDRDNNAFLNLRLITLRENVRASLCKSGMPYGVRLRGNGTYRVVLRVDGRMCHLGTFKTMADAVVRRDAHLLGA